MALPEDLPLARARRRRIAFGGRTVVYFIRFGPPCFLIRASKRTTTADVRAVVREAFGVSVVRVRVELHRGTSGHRRRGARIKWFWVYLGSPTGALGEWEPRPERPRRRGPRHLPPRSHGLCSFRRPRYAVPPPRGS